MHSSVPDQFVEGISIICVPSPDQTHEQLSRVLAAGLQKVGTAGTAGAGQTTFGWTK